MIILFLYVEQIIRMMISIQQPESFPWLGFFDKILQVDKVVFLDNVQFKKRYFENRNKIRTPQGWIWLNTPVKTKGRYTQKIMEVEIDNSRPWQKKLISTITQHYRKAPHWKETGDELCEIISKPYELLADFNLAIIFFFMEKLSIKREWTLASSLNTKHSGSYLIWEICQKMNATDYLSGINGKNYLKEEDFIKRKIRIHYQRFRHPIYKQVYDGFEAGMSIIDLYFNHGPDSTNIIKGTTS